MRVREHLGLVAQLVLGRGAAGHEGVGSRRCHVDPQRLWVRQLVSELPGWFAAGSRGLSLWGASGEIGLCFGPRLRGLQGGTAGTTGLTMLRRRRVTHPRKRAPERRSGRGSSSSGGSSGSGLGSGSGGGSGDGGGGGGGGGG